MNPSLWTHMYTYSVIPTTSNIPHTHTHTHRKSYCRNLDNIDLGLLFRIFVNTNKTDCSSLWLILSHNREHTAMFLIWAPASVLRCFRRAWYVLVFSFGCSETIKRRASFNWARLYPAPIVTPENNRVEHKLKVNFNKIKLHGNNFFKYIFFF
jgi:hypothetical protein